MKKLRYVFWALLLTILVCLTGCTARDYIYEGKHKDLYTVAVCNIFGAYGCGWGIHFTAAPNIEIIENDDYGRTLFFYDENDGDLVQFFGTAILIMQKSEGGYVYYYQDDCYTPYYNVDRPTYNHPEYSEIFTEEAIAQLKERNDWNKEINIEKCTKSKIVNKKEDSPLRLKDKDFDNAITPYLTSLGYNVDGGVFSSARFCNADKYRRSLFLVYARRDFDDVENSSDYEYRYFELAMIFNPDKSCPIENIYDISDTSLDFCEIIKSLKQTAGWNQPYENA